MGRRLEVWYAGGIVATVFVPANPAPGDVPVLSGIPLEVMHLIQNYAFGFGDTCHHCGYRWWWEDASGVSWTNPHTTVVWREPLDSRHPYRHDVRQSDGDAARYWTRRFVALAWSE